MRLTAVLALLLFALVLAGDAFAQSAPQIQFEADGNVAGVGDSVHVQMSATSADTMPSDPQLGAVTGFVVRRQNASPSQTHISINGARSDRYTLTVDWLLQAQRVGAYTLGPPSVTVGGRRFSGPSIDVRVVPAGKAPPRSPPPQAQQNPFGLSPFDPWRGLFPDFAAPEPPQEPAIATDPKLALGSARDSLYFLHATVDKTNVVMGEQVTFDVLEYVDISANGLEGEEDHDPRADDFVKHSLLHDDQDPPVLGYASIGDRTWRVRLVRQWALFPLKSGDLEIGPMTVTIHVTSRHGSSMKRASEALHVRVADPPVVGRPPGYAQGDVGRFALHADVDPRTVTQGGAIGVHVELSGTGNVPGNLNPPSQAGVEWLQPEVHDALGPAGHDRYGGKRTFDFVVRMNRPGDVDLGQLTLPFFDPERRSYEVARAPLGIVHVAPSASAPAEAASEVLPGLPPPRDSLEGMPKARKFEDDSVLFWIVAVAGGPLAFGVAFAGDAARKRIVGAWRSRRVSPAAELRERMAVAHAACGGEDARRADAAIVRVLEAAAVASAGVSVRGALWNEVVTRLEDAGVAHQAAVDVAALLRECETARFAPDASDLSAARGRWDRAQRTVRLLEKRA